MKARADREALRFTAAEMFECGVDVGKIARDLAVTRKSVNVWKRAWRDRGVGIQGAGRVEVSAGRGATQGVGTGVGRGAGRGWAEDQRWTLARVATVVWEQFKVRYTLRGVSFLLHRIGWSPQVPQHVAAERDEEKVTTWVKETWPHIKVLPPV